MSGSLTPSHRAELEGSGLTGETISAAGLYSASGHVLSDILGFGVPCGGWVVPYQENGDGRYSRVKLDPAGADADGKRYRSPRGQGNRLYIPPPLLLDPVVLTSPACRLYVTEGEKKALKACQEGLDTIAVSGVWAWRTKDRDTLGRAIEGPGRPMADLDRIVWRGRDVTLVWDSDVVTKPQVQRAETALAQELHRRGARVDAVRLPPGPAGTKVGLDDYLRTHSVEAFCAIEPVPIAGADDAAAPGDSPAPGSDAGLAYIETLADFLADADPPTTVIFPDLLPVGVIMLLHGEPRSRKSLAALELALSAATRTAPFGLARFRPSEAFSVLYVQEEDPRSLTRPRLRRLVSERCGDSLPEGLYVSVRRGINLDDPEWVRRLIADLTRRDVRLLVLDAARRFSAKTDEGPTKVREFTAVLRSIVTATGVSIIIVHHDTKPPVNGQDGRRRSQRASGGDWFAVSECPVHVERIDDAQSLVYPQDYKFTADPAPFTFRLIVDRDVVARLVGTATTPALAESSGARGKLLAWLKANGPATRTPIRKAGFAWETVQTLLDDLMRTGLVDAHPGRRKDSLVYFATERGNDS